MDVDSDQGWVVKEEQDCAHETEHILKIGRLEGGVINSKDSFGWVRETTVSQLKDLATFFIEA